MTKVAPTTPAVGSAYTFVGEARGKSGWAKTTRYARAVNDAEAISKHNSFPEFRTLWIGQGHRTVWRKP